MDPEVGENIRTYMAEVLADLRDYAADFSPATRESLLLHRKCRSWQDPCGAGHCREVLRQNYDVIYVSSPDFFGKIEALHFGSDPNGEEDTLFQTASNADLLILDDLGTEFNSSFFLTNLYSLLNNRLGAGLPTIVTTNITDGAFAGKTLYRKNLQPPCRFRPDQVLRQRYPRSESERVKEKATQKLLFPFCTQNSNAGLTSLRRCACTMQSLSGTTPAAPSVLNTVCRASAGCIVLL